MVAQLDPEPVRFSECRRWRWVLRRDIGEGPPLIMLMLNPSTADEVKNDPTVERCERRARREGYGSLIVLNIFAFRATKPADMKAEPNPIGDENDDYIRRYLELAASVAGAKVCAAWGNHGKHLGRSADILEMAKTAGVDLVCLKRTKAGQPGHPLYVKNNAEFLAYA